jgi:hypothetical protein
MFLGHLLLSHKCLKLLLLLLLLLLSSATH